LNRGTPVPVVVFVDDPVDDGKLNWAPLMTGESRKAPVKKLAAGGGLVKTSILFMVVYMKILSRK
jgi:hypothetical protein